MSRRKFTPKFNSQVVLEALKERTSLSELAQKHALHPQQINKWKREFLSNAESIFLGVNKASSKTESEEERDRLLRTIGSQKVELDFLKKNLR